MTYSHSQIGFGILLGGILFVCSFSPVQAAEIRLKQFAVQCPEPLVTLADIADVLPMGNENVEPLRQVVLFPTPDEGAAITLDQWQLRTMLSQLGVNTLHHSISGAEKITVDGVAVRNAAPVNPNDQFIVRTNYLTPSGTNTVIPIAVRSEAAPKTAGLHDDMAKLLEKQVAQALNIYLNFTNRIERTWDISLKLTPEQVKFFASNGQIVEITGGQIPFTGMQQFHVRMQNNITVTVDAVVTLPTEVVIVRRALPKGHIVSESDVMLQRANKINGDDFFVDIKNVVGKETVKAVKELTPLTQSAVRQPLWVRRGDIVTVRALSGGIVVRTEAAALQDGVEGDTITVSKIDLSPKKGKKEDAVTYLVRVCAPKTVEVFVK
jgi:flagella basal body P-ring formation protein FlgA